MNVSELAGLLAGTAPDAEVVVVNRGFFGELRHPGWSVSEVQPIRKPRPDGRRHIAVGAWMLTDPLKQFPDADSRTLYLVADTWDVEESIESKK